MKKTALIILSIIIVNTLLAQDEMPNSVFMNQSSIINENRSCLSDNPFNVNIYTIECNGQKIPINLNGSTLILMGNTLKYL